VNGSHPPRPDTPNVLDEHWDLMTRCWSLEPNSRPQTKDLDHYFRTYGSPACRIPGIALFDLRHQLHRGDVFRTTNGGMLETWTGTHRSSNGSTKVAIKVLRFTSETDSKEQILDAVRVWRNLAHENILPVFGITTEFWPFFALVCPWYGTSLTPFLASHLGNALKIDERINIIRQVAVGLSYLHSIGIVHGGLNGWNVLIKNGIVRLTNFGLIPLLLQLSAMSEKPPASFFEIDTRWADPDIRAGSPGVSVTPSRNHDVYSLGSIMLQVLSGDILYDYFWPTSASLRTTDLEQFKRLRAKRSPLITDAHWNLLNDCWANDPLSRPTVSGVLQRLLAYQEEPLASSIEVAYVGDNPVEY